MESIQEFFKLIFAAASILSIIWPVWLIVGISLVVKISYKLYQNLCLSKANINQIDEMDGKEFEDYLAVLFRKLGYSVRKTPYQGDFGGDLVIRKDGNRCVVQAKRYKRSVGVKAVQEVVAAKDYYKCNSAMVVTNSDYTKQAVKLAKANKVELWNRHKLVSAILSVKGKASPNQAHRHANPQTIEDSNTDAWHNPNPQPMQTLYAPPTNSAYPQTMQHSSPQPMSKYARPMTKSAPTPTEDSNVRSVGHLHNQTTRKHTSHRSGPQMSCQICGNPVSQRIVDYCRSHRSALRGEVYCFEHLNELQARPKAARPVSARQAPSPPISSSLNQTL